MRIAIVGAGPAGFYTAAHLLESHSRIELDMIERLPTPWGLVRLGVAPDHPKIKAVSRVFEEIAAQDGFRFLGNVEVGRDLTHDELCAHYDAVVYAVGAQIDRPLRIPGEDLSGSLPSASFVGWYNGHPDHTGLEPDLSCKTALVIGNGNVALDVARMLVIDPAELRATDIADQALRVLAGSSVEEVVVLGRRGPAQASFTTPELRELGGLAGVAVVIDRAELDVREPAETLARRNLETLRGWTERPAHQAAKTLRLRFCRSVTALHGNGRVEWAEITRNRLETDADETTITAMPTGESETIRCGLVLRSVGYQGRPPAGVPFDERTGTIRNRGGRVAPGVYCSGWIKRGPTGVIGTNKKDAAETVGNLLADIRAGLVPAQGKLTAEGSIDDLLEARGVRAVGGEGWARIDAAERALGQVEGRPRVKLCGWGELLATALPEPAASGSPTRSGISRSAWR